MAVTSKLKKQVDLPVWEWMRPSPISTNNNSTTNLASQPYNGGRYIYQLQSNTNVWRYDTVSDSWNQLAGMPTAPATAATTCYSSNHGYHGRVISSGGGLNTVEMAALQGEALVGYTIRIVSGTGAGQERVITNVSNPIVKDRGIVTSGTTGTAQIVDAQTGIGIKQWKINQYKDYQVRVIYNTAAGSLVRPILHNNYNTLTFYDVAWSSVTPWWGPIAPIGASSGTGTSHYQIESNIVTVDSNWTTPPDNTSSFVVLCEGIWYLSSNSTNPFWSIQYYSPIQDVWYVKSQTGGLIGAALATDITSQGLLFSPTNVLSGTATGATSRTLSDSTVSSILSANQYTNYELRILSGTGVGQFRSIVMNSLSSFTIGESWDVIPDNTSVYGVYRDANKIYWTGNGSSSIYYYAAEFDFSSQSKIYDYGVARSMSAAVSGIEPISVASIARTTGGISVLNSTPTAGGTGYQVDQILTITTGGTGGTARITSVNSVGAVTGVVLETAGTNYTTGTGRATTVSPAGGTGCTLNITTIADIATVTTSIAHPFKIGDTVTIVGASPSNYNGSFTIISTNANTTFGYVVAGTPTTPATFTAQSVTTLTDVTKNWATNEHVGKIVNITTAASPTAASQTRLITANTSNTLTFATATAPTVSTSRYIIVDPKPFATAVTNENAIVDNLVNGQATSGSSTTLVDTTKNWPINYWSTGASRTLRILAGTGAGATIPITSNTSNTLTFGTQTFSVDNTTVYEILVNFGTATGGSVTTLVDSTQNWPNNIFIGKRVKLLTGTAATNEYTITGNTSNTLSFNTATAPDTTTAYAILEPNTRSTGNSMVYIRSSTDNSLNRKYFYMLRGGNTNEIGRYNHITEQFEFLTYFPFSETFTTGTMTSYDGVDRIYIHKDATGRISYYDVAKNQIVNSSTVPYGMGTAILGNRMEVVTTEDGLSYLYVLRHSSQEFWRTLLFW